MDSIEHMLPSDVTELVREFKGPSFADTVRKTQAQANLALQQKQAARAALFAKIETENMLAATIHSCTWSLSNWARENPEVSVCIARVYCPLIFLDKFQAIDHPEMTMEEVKKQLVKEYIRVLKAKCDGIVIRPMQQSDRTLSSRHGPDLFLESYDRPLWLGDWVLDMSIENWRREEIGEIVLDWTA